MEKEFVPYELALKLKELGFNEECLAFFYKEEDVVFETCTPYNANRTFNYISAPLWQQAFDWFRKKYNIVCTIYANGCGYMWEMHYTSESKGGTFINDSGETGDCEMSGMFTAYEKARLECLKKLIEIVEKYE